MSTYQLRNGFVIDDLQFTRPLISKGTPPSLFIDKSNILRSKLTFTTAEISSNDIQPAISHVAEAKIKHFTRDQVSQNSLRFAQTIEVSVYQVTYFGAKPEDGSIIWFLRGDAIKPMLDCLTIPTRDTLLNIETLAAVASPFYNRDITIRAPDSYLAQLSDSPGANIPLVVVNSITKQNNYLSSFASSARFKSLVIFEYSDKTRDPLESWAWTCERQVDVVWRKGEPAISGAAQSSVTAAADKEVIFRRSGFEALVLQKLIINIVTAQALDNLRSSPDVSFIELGPNKINAPAGFWNFT